MHFWSHNFKSLMIDGIFIAVEIQKYSDKNLDTA